MNLSLACRPHQNVASRRLPVGHKAAYQALILIKPTMTTRAQRPARPAVAMDMRVNLAQFSSIADFIRGRQIRCKLDGFHSVSASSLLKVSDAPREFEGSKSSAVDVRRYTGLF